MRALSSVVNRSVVALWSLGLLACSFHSATVDPDGATAPPDADSPPPVVRIARGVLQGTVEAGALSFKGIPYAAPPIGALRWRAPQPPAAWTGVRDASQFGSGCIATSVDMSSGLNQVIGGSEDCLTLNVWTSNATPSSPMPVMVFIHGGYFQQGSSADTFGGLPMYDGAYVAAHQPVVVVTINYRLGALGFLADSALAAADPDHHAGNYGLLDQIAALEWVQTNIAAFGGDPTRVMVFGQSAGGYSVCNLLVSPLANGLFSRAVIESGGCSVFPRATALAAGTRVEKALGCDTSPDIAGCLRATTANQAATAIPAYGWTYELSPNVDPGTLGQPMNVIAAAQQHHVPVIVGTNANEVASMVNEYLSGPIPTDAAYKAELEYEYGIALGDQVYHHYPSANYPRPRDAYIAARSDSDFTCPARQVMRALAGAHSAPAYRYFYTHTLDEGPYMKWGAPHAFELIFVFHVFDPVTFPTGHSDAEGALSDAIIGYWTRFAATGDPNGAGAPSWPAYVAATDPYLALDETFTAGAGIHPARCDFWDANGY
jgi:para-nitrobenzyl esterase